MMNQYPHHIIISEFWHVLSVSPSASWLQGHLNLRLNRKVPDGVRMRTYKLAQAHVLCVNTVWILCEWTVCVLCLLCVRTCVLFFVLTNYKKYLLKKKFLVKIHVLYENLQKKNYSYLLVHWLDSGKLSADSRARVWIWMSTWSRAMDGGPQ